MKSTTTQKKEIIDYLWEWAESQGDWGKLLIHDVVTFETNLPQTSLDNVFNYFLQGVGLFSGLPSISTSKPKFIPNTQKVEITSISNITGVNKLAKDQKIDFCPNLTVIYGENGTGKSSYGKILKTLGFSYDKNDTIHNNIFEPPEPKSAEIEYEIGNAKKSFNWDGSNKNASLASVSVFNNRCVQISLSDNRQLIVSPIGFHLFNLVSGQLDSLRAMLDAKINSYNTTLYWKNDLNYNTPQKKFIDNLSTGSSLNDLKSFSTFKARDQSILDTKRSERGQLNKKLIETEANNLELIIRDIEKNIAKIEDSKKSLNPDRIGRIKEYENKLIELKNKSKLGLKDILSMRGLDFYATNEFQSFVKSAELFIRSIDKVEYPSEDESCIYCLQPLESQSKDLITQYRAILNDTTQEEIKITENLLAQELNGLDNSRFHLLLQQPVFGFDDNHDPIQHNLLTKFNQTISRNLSSITKKTIRVQDIEGIDFQSVLELLSNEKIKVEKEYRKKHQDLQNLNSIELQLKVDTDELRDRKLLSTKETEIQLVIQNLKTIEKLKSFKSSFNTRQISLRTSQARQELVQKNFNSIFKQELKYLRKAHLNVDLNFSTDKGNSKISQKVNAHILGEILSEGEQKAIALAEFLTELQLDDSVAPVIFDDPVNSLDHIITSEVAKRLIKLSKKRQVIVFTHSVLLFNDFLSSVKLSLNKGMASKFYNLKNEYGHSGYVNEAEEEINKVTAYIKKINALLNNQEKGVSESDLARRGYGHLRSAIELCVEHEILQGSVKRYQKNIALTSFMKVNGSKLNEHKEEINNIFERCCGFISGHSNPIAINSSPNIIGLKQDFDEFKNIRKDFT